MKTVLLSVCGLWFVVCVVVVVLHCDLRTMSRARSFARSNIPYPSHSLDKWAQFWPLCL
jgi:hypothetical protein